jgi:hypothetical protein
MKKLALLFFLVLLGNYALAAADFYIVSIALSSETIEEGSASIGATVVVRNQGTDGAQCYLKLSAAGKPAPPDQDKFIDAGGGTQTFTFSPIDIRTWESGNYAFVAKACADDPCTDLQSQVTKTLTVKPRKRQLVPELDVLLLPLIAFAALAVVFFSGKRN